MDPFENRRILVIDDEPSIHGDFRNILDAPPPRAELSALEASLFGTQPDVHRTQFLIRSAHQGREGLELAQHALGLGEPYCIAFVDMRMPPGWDGLRTIEELWKADPRMQIVICTAYSDRSWNDVLRRLAARDRLLIVKKPFDPIEVQLASETLSAKWGMERQAESQIEGLEQSIAQLTHRIAELEAANAAHKHS